MNAETGNEDPRIVEARRLMREVDRDTENRRKESLSKDLCICLHPRANHGKSYSINFTEGFCNQCSCRHFIMNLSQHKVSPVRRGEEEVENANVTENKL